MRYVHFYTFYILFLISGTVTQAQVLLINENFNGAGTPAGWININNSTGGNMAVASWTLRADGYSYSSNIVSPPEIFHSNDHSQFYLSNSDSQEGDITATILQSPPFNTVGYPYITLNFYHYFWEYANDSGIVEVSTNNLSWTRVATYKYPEESREGSSNSFVQKTIDLSGFSGNPVLHVRFRYYAEFGYYWALDNVSVSGALTMPCVVNYWEGTINTAWENPSNWSCGIIPGAGTTVYINAGKPNYPIIGSMATCKSLIAAPGASVQVAGGYKLDITGP